MTRKVRIECGSANPADVKITDVITGAEITHVTAVRFDAIEMGKLISASLDVVVRGGFSIVADATVITKRMCDRCGAEHDCLDPEST